MKRAIGRSDVQYVFDHQQKAELLNKLRRQKKERKDSIITQKLVGGRRQIETLIC